MPDLVALASDSSQRTVLSTDCDHSRVLRCQVIKHEPAVRTDNAAALGGDLSYDSENTLLLPPRMQIMRTAGFTTLCMNDAPSHFATVCIRFTF